MKISRAILFMSIVCFVAAPDATAQLNIVTNSNAQALAQKIAGEGVSISNVTLTGGSLSTGFFNNRGGTNLRLDSGIVLTTGRAKTSGAEWGLNSDGTQAFVAEAATPFGLPGDLDLANAIGTPLDESFDATVLEFDFVPQGDSVKFNYVFASEEYQPDFVCEFNDAFAFFISGPGIPGLKNIALIPGTSTPVSIINVNDVRDEFGALCPRHPEFYVDNSTNRMLTYNGHTTVLTAKAAVNPCQTYHMKLVIMDVVDDFFDSGVFLEAGSLRSEPIKIDNKLPVLADNTPYLAEGCISSAIHIYRDAKKPFSQSINLTFGGTATNGTDITLIPATVLIPANDSVVVIPITALADAISDHGEVLKIYVSPGGCGPIATPLDSIFIRILDVAPLSITPKDSARICRNSSQQLEAESGYGNYSWTGGGLSAGNIRNPVATPTTAATTYVCTAVTGTCTARDSVVLRWKQLELVSKNDIACKDGVTGTIRVKGIGWQGPLTYAIDNGVFGPGDNFTGLPAGTHWVKAKDASGCVDSLRVDLIQSFPDLDLTTTQVAATCSIVPDGTINVTATGGSSPYMYGTTPASFANSNIITVAEGGYTVYVRDANNCIASLAGVIVPKINNVVVDAQPDDFICEGTGYALNATTNAASVNWTPAATITNGTTLNPVASPAVSQYYFITATTGSCVRKDSVLLTVRPAPIPDAGDDVTICYGVTTTLAGTGGLEYSWKPDVTFTTATDIANPTAAPKLSTTYLLDVTDIHGCQSLQPDGVLVTVTPPVAIFAGNDTVVALNQPLQLNAVDVNASGITSWSWTSTSFLSNPLINAPVALFTSPSLVSPYQYNYRITGTTDEGCVGWDDILIKVYHGPEIYVASGFTPNGDGRNDLLLPVPVGIKDFHYFRVFNRWGQAVFQTSDPTRGWAGTLLEKKQATGVYVWMAAGIDYLGKPVVRKGTVTLLR